MDIKTRIENAKQQLRAAEQAKTVAETQLQAATEQCNAIMEEMKAAGVTPETIQAVIDQATKEINDELGQIEAAIPRV